MIVRKAISDLRGFYKEKREGERKEREGALQTLRQNSLRSLR